MANSKVLLFTLVAIGMSAALPALAQDLNASSVPNLKFDVTTTEYSRSFSIENQGRTIAAREKSGSDIFDITVELREGTVITTRKNAVFESRNVVDLKAAATAVAADPLKAQEELRLSDFFNQQLQPVFGFSGGDHAKRGCQDTAATVQSAANQVVAACSGPSPGAACTAAVANYQIAVESMFRCFEQER